MKAFYLYVFILTCIIILVPYYNLSRRSKEGFETNTKTIVLLGDSILKNNMYVTKGVDERLKKASKCKIVSLARDKTTIGHTYKQIDDIPDELNDPSTVIFLSVGGNDIIESYVDGPYDAEEDKGYLIKLFDSYKLLINTLREKMDKSKVILLDIYYPTSKRYKEYYLLIEKWNQMQGEMKCDVVKISEIMTQPQDFAFEIEPSDQGGEKIANAIISTF